MMCEIRPGGRVMNPALIAVIVFVLAAAVIVLLYSQSARAIMVMEPGETVVMEEAPVRVEHVAPVRTAVYTRCRVTVTDRRILIVQAALFGKSYNVPRFVISFRTGGEETNLGASLKKGYLLVSVPGDRISVEPGGAAGSPALVTVPVPGSALTVNQFVRYSTAHAADYENLFR